MILSQHPKIVTEGESNLSTFVGELTHGTLAAGEIAIVDPIARTDITNFTTTERIAIAFYREYLDRSGALLKTFHMTDPIDKRSIVEFKHVGYQPEQPKSYTLTIKTPPTFPLVDDLYLELVYSKYQDKDTLRLYGNYKKTIQIKIPAGTASLAAMAAAIANQINSSGSTTVVTGLDIQARSSTVVYPVPGMDTTNGLGNAVTGSASVIEFQPKGTGFFYDFQITFGSGKGGFGSGDTLAISTRVGGTSAVPFEGSGTKRHVDILEHAYVMGSGHTGDDVKVYMKDPEIVSALPTIYVQPTTAVQTAPAAPAATDGYDLFYLKVKKASYTAWAQHEMFHEYFIFLRGATAATLLTNLTSLVDGIFTGGTNSTFTDTQLPVSDNM